MVSKKTFVKIISGVLIGGTILSAGSIAFADSKGNNALKGNRGNLAHKSMMKSDKMAPGKGVGRMMPGNMNEKMQAALKELVGSGTITQAKVDELSAYMTKKNEERKDQFEKIKNMTPEQRKEQFEKDREQNKGKRQDVLEEVVAQGILTQEQVSAIKDKMQQLNENDRKKYMSDALNSIVQKGIINQEQVDKILQYMDSKKSQMKDIMDKTKDMTPEKRREYIKNNMGEIKNPVSQLVDEGIITNDQSKEINKALHQKGSRPYGKEGGNPARRQGAEKPSKGSAEQK